MDMTSERSANDIKAVLPIGHGTREGPRGDGDPPLRLDADVRRRV
jgi:hypothetical protein